MTVGFGVVGTGMMGRIYVRALADVDTSPRASADTPDTLVSVRADFTGPVRLVQQVVQIVREGVANVERHARARSATVSVHQEGEQLVIRLDDDGIGLPDDGTLPWSISSRVRELGGQIGVVPAASSGAHLVIALPEA